MKLKIGVMGAASSNLSKTHKKMAYEVGRAVVSGRYDCFMPVVTNIIALSNDLRLLSWK